MDIPTEIINEILLRLPAKSIGRFKCVSKSWLALISGPQLIIVTQILRRLPAKSLGQFKTVSKSWLALISEPQFHKDHLHTSYKRTHLFYESFINGTICTLPFNPLHDETPKLSPFFTGEYSFKFHGSCNGLVLGSVDEYVDIPYSLVVLNPTTKELIKLIKNGYEMMSNDYTCGLGYDSLTDDYKVVRLSFDQDYDVVPSAPKYVQVYSLRNNNWRRVKNYPYNNYHDKDMPGVFVNGFLHWRANKRSYGVPLVIVAFSLANETFSKLPLPNWGDDVNAMLKYRGKLVVVGEKLGIFWEDEVWLMHEYGVGESWSKIIIYGFNEFSRVEPIIYSEDDKYMLVGDNLLCVYDVEEEYINKTIDIHIPSDIEDTYVKGIYVESLISLKSSLTNQILTSSSEGSRVEPEETEGATTDDDDMEDDVTGSEESRVSTIFPPLLSYEEALADDNESKLSELEAYLKSIEDEKLVMEGKLAALSNELSSEKDRALRITADFDNFRKKTERERISFVENLLPVLDQFERAIKVENDKEEKINNSYESIYKQFVEILTSHGVIYVEKAI